jgi:hypothetical protein
MNAETLEMASAARRNAHRSAQRTLPKPHARNEGAAAPGTWCQVTAPLTRLAIADSYDPPGLQGRLDLFPYDLGDARSVPLAHRISSDELAAWLRDLDAGELILILDTWRAGAATGHSFRAGPMGDPGLGQVAYDMRARILAAAQADGEATGSFLLQQGLLTYALAREALDKLQLATEAPFPWSRWLHYAERRVPELFKQYVAQEPTTKLQVPALFDFGESAQDLIVPPPQTAISASPAR